MGLIGSQLMSFVPPLTGVIPAYHLYCSNITYIVLILRRVICKANGSIEVCDTPQSTMSSKNAQVRSNMDSFLTKSAIRSSSAIFVALEERSPLTKYTENWDLRSQRRMQLAQTRTDTFSLESGELATSSSLSLSVQEVVEMQDDCLTELIGRMTAVSLKSTSHESGVGGRVIDQGNGSSVNPLRSLGIGVISTAATAHDLKQDQKKRSWATRVEESISQERLDIRLELYRDHLD